MSKSCLHFVGFRDDAFTRAKNIFGNPDFVHRLWDRIACSDVAPGDTVVFASDDDWTRFTNNQTAHYSFNDSEYF